MLRPAIVTAAAFSAVASANKIELNGAGSTISFDVGESSPLDVTKATFDAYSTRLAALESTSTALESASATQAASITALESASATQAASITSQAVQLTALEAKLGYWLRVTPAMLHQQYSGRTDIAYSTDEFGGAVVQVSNSETDCGSGKGDLHFVRPGIPWTKIKFNQTVVGSTACWGIFSRGGSYIGANSPNTEDFDASKGDLFSGDYLGDFNPVSPSRCDNACDYNMWHGCTSGRPTSAIVELRKVAAATDAGFATSLTCNGNDAGYTYSSIYVWV